MPGGFLFTQRKINNNNNNSTEKEKIYFEIQYRIKQTLFSNEILMNERKTAEEENKMKMFKFLFRQK